MRASHKTTAVQLRKKRCFEQRENYKTFHQCYASRMKNHQGYWQQSEVISALTSSSFRKDRKTERHCLSQSPGFKVAFTASIKYGKFLVLPIQRSVFLFYIYLNPLMTFDVCRLKRCDPSGALLH